MTDEDFMQLALAEARKALDEGNEPFGGVVVKDGEIVVRAHNTINTSMDVTAHSETESVRAANKALGALDLSGCTLYSSWEPCAMCCGAILESNIDALVLGGRELNKGPGEYTVEKLIEMAGHSSCPRVITGVLQDECIELVDGWRKRVNA
jgi:tRNA(adenine34) deaminase